MSRVHLRSPAGEPLCGRVPAACACMTSDIAETTCRWCLDRGALPRVKPSRPFHHRHAAQDVLAALQGEPRVTWDRRRWTPAEDEVVTANSVPVAAARLNRTEKSVSIRKYRLCHKEAP